MLFKNNMTPAYAHAGYANVNNEPKRKDEDLTMMASKDDDFENYASQKSSPKKRPSQGAKQPPKKASSHKSEKKFLPIVFAIIAIIAIIVVIAIIVAIINAPGSNMKKNDIVYLSYKDADGNYRVVVNDEEKEDITFENKIEIIPAANNSFVYILESLEKDKTKIHILHADSDELDSSQRTADEILYKETLQSTTNPCVIYKIDANKKDDDYTIYCFKGNGSDNKITNDSSADNFVVANDASKVFFTTGTSKLSLHSYSGLAPDSMGIANFIPYATSPDGRYVYGIKSSQQKTLYCIDTEEIVDDVATVIAKINIDSGKLYEINAMNADGDQIIFSATSGETKFVSYFYEIGDEGATKLANGKFISNHPDPVVLFEDSLLDSFFTVQSISLEENDDGEMEETVTSESTYYVSSDRTAQQLASTTGKFSPNGKHFYYINDDKVLKRISLSSRDFENIKGGESMSSSGVVDFFITQDGDIYTLYEDDSTPDGTQAIYYCDSSDPEPIHRFNEANSGTVFLSVNTLYFSATKKDDDGKATTVVYSITDGSNASKADFSNEEITQSPEFYMGAGKKGYAYVITDKSTGEATFFYTSDGKTFEKICAGFIIK